MIAEQHLGPAAAPVLVLFAGLVLETALAVRRRRGTPRGPGWTLAAWAARPWYAWGLLNLLFRWQWERGFNNRCTFPFYANLWWPEAGWREALGGLARRPTLWGWGAAVLALLLLVLWLARRFVTAAEAPRRRTMAWVLPATWLAAVGLPLSIACLPDGAGTAGGPPGSLLSAWRADSTMLYAVPLVRSSDHYLRHFEELHPRLRRTIHGYTHPPLASLSLYWIGRVAGAGGSDIRSAATRLRYTVGLTAFSALGLFVLFGIGRTLFGDARTGLLTALLWLTAPAYLAYATFSQDPLYAVVFNLVLWLSWRVATGPADAAWREGVALGVALCLLLLLNFSGVLAAAAFGLFLLVRWRARRWRFGELVRRGGVPLAVMLAAFKGFLVYTGLDYWALYGRASAYVREWYPFDGAYQSLTALVGGQLELLLMIGSVTAAAFLVALAGIRRADLGRPRAAWLLCLLLVYAVAVLFGPNPLRMETARCWFWVASVPIAFAADTLRRHRHARLLVPGAVAVSALTAAGLRLFLDFAA